MILVTGATGNIGRELVPQLLHAGQRVRVFVRNKNKVANLSSQVERAVGDLDNPETLKAAMEGVEQVFLVTMGTPQQDIDAVEAARRAGVRQIVKLSSLEAGKPHLQIGRWHREREQIIESSGIGWTFLRPGMFMSNSIEWWSETIKQRGAVYFPGKKGKTAPIAPQDIAAVAAVALTEPGHASQTYELTGAELLTIGEMAQMIGQVIGKPVRYTNVPLFAARLQMRMSGMNRILVNALMEVAEELRSNQAAYRTETVERVTGYPPQTFEAWCREHIAAFRS